jgi:hypothetical protein
LRVALLLALVHPAVELALAEVPALEHACPAFYHRLVAFDDVRSMAFSLIAAVSAEQLFLHLPTVALGRYTFFASSTEACVTRSWTCVLTTRHRLVTNFATAPARVIIGV